jgi:DNA-binding transcriptional LysR family regulator
MEHLHAIESLARRETAPQLRVSAVASALVRLVPHALARFHRDWPASRLLTVQGDDDELAAWLEADTIDLAVTTQPFGDQGDTASEVQVELTDQFLAVLPRHHPLSRGDRVGLAKLMNAGVADPGGTCGPRGTARGARGETNQDRRATHRWMRPPDPAGPPRGKRSSGQKD